MNEILFFGLNKYPKLFTNQPKKIFRITQVKFENENEKQIKQISSGDFSVIFLFKNGKAIEYLNDSSNQNPEKSKLKKIFKKKKDINPNNPNEFINISSLIEDPNDRIIQDVVSSADSIYLLTSNQNVYGIGSNKYGQLGFDSKTLDKTEKPILMMKNVSKIFSGNYSLAVFLLNSNQELFGCGYNYTGQLGKIIDIQVGSSHSLILVENEKDGKRKLYSCGYSIFTGIGKSVDTREFTETKSSLFENDNIREISVGNYHTLIFTSNEKLIGFGTNNYGELGTGKKGTEKIPIQIRTS
ncbi:hypothetical protein M0811_08629 [Anaeramoeba ignava]|uniref:Regulator of chromosome condensation n=1 Tax=Anaeramoeba ignava TaxID=1746090 RepID=A0A9Q0RAV9_ANAIG|nr:hypothetical protein M0811_08629 [Anaeramoeba ignava]